MLLVGRQDNHASTPPLSFLQAANPQTKPVDLGCESAENWQLSSTSTIAIIIITQLVGWYSFYHPTKDGRLSRLKHCSKGAQPVLKTVYRSSRRDKHNYQRRDSNLDPLTPQSDALTTRLLRPAYCEAPVSSSVFSFHTMLRRFSIDTRWVYCHHVHVTRTTLTDNEIWQR